MKIANLETYRHIRKLKDEKIQKINEIVSKDLEEELSNEDEEILKQIGILMPEFEGSTI